MYTILYIILYIIKVVVCVTVQYAFTESLQQHVLI